MLRSRPLAQGCISQRFLELQATQPDEQWDLSQVGTLHGRCIAQKSKLSEFQVQCRCLSVNSFTVC
jgi:hypothetical protein